MEVLLGLLTIAPMSGYDLGQLIQDSIHYFWRESYGQIYPSLKQLSAEGFVTGKSEKHGEKLVEGELEVINQKGEATVKGSFAVAAG